MKKLVLLTVSFLSFVSLSFAETFTNQEITKKTYLDNHIQKFIDLKEFEIEEDFQLLKLSMEMEKEFKDISSYSKK